MTKSKLTIKEFADLCMVSDKTVRKTVKSVKSFMLTAHLVTEEGGHRKQFLDRSLLERFINPYFLQVEHKYVSLLKRSKIENYAGFLALKEWQLFGTIAFDARKSNSTCIGLMKNLHTYLKVLYPNNEVRIFFANELNPGSLGYHTHFVAYVSGDIKWTTLRDKVSGFLRVRANCVTHITEFDPAKDGLKYITKDLEVTPDGYDYLDSVFNDLEGELFDDAIEELADDAA